ncbi:multiple sugar transport system substrate-binding protein [Paenibacillus castaneae]|uniref:ABC transporter substrate-binding protein n=1 Tax=Paenibacillus castaneae TaxID=474957 RepID=UPI000C9BA275|nr:extracellular solute-binding protein [Paenibacillus castaneae]NIK78445.1 multiple sugar transport system substrate-binding protein [Paenibacillus castaneae]
MKAWSKFVIPVALFALVLSGCSFGGGKKDLDKNQESTLRVMYYDEGSFFQEYGMVFSALYPNIDIEVINNRSMYTEETKDYDAALVKFMEEKKPDIVMLSSDQYKKLAMDGKLYELDSVIEKEKYDTEGLVPGMLDYLREQGGGKIFGFSPSFYSQVLFYNKDIFDEYKIEYPTDRMSWNEVIQLARRFPTEGEPKERIYGLKMGYNEDLFDIASTFASSEGVSYVNASQKKMTINSDSWRNAFQNALDAINSKALFFESSMYSEDGNMAMGSTYEDYLLRDPFVSGRLAMAIGDNYYINQIKQALENEKIKDQVVKNWDLVTVPVGQQNPDQSTMMGFNNLFSISADSPNKEAAWQFLSYITSDEFSRVKSKSNNYNGMPIRTKYIKDEEGHNYAAFYNLKPSTFNSYKDFEKLPENFWMEFRTATSEELQKVKDNTQSIDEALDILQIRGQEMLEKESPAAPGGAEPANEVNSDSAGESDSVSVEVAR